MDSCQATIGEPLAMLKHASAVGFASSPRLPQVGIAGYNMHKKAALAIALNVLKGGEKRVMAFGLPGSGVQRFPHAVISDLQRKLGIQVFLIHISCDKLILNRKISKVMEETSRKISQVIEKNADEKGLAFILIDNPEALSYTYENFYEAKRMIIPWLSSILERKFDRTVVFCTSDDPSIVESSIISSFEYPIYLRYLDIDSLVSVVRAYLNGREDARQIAAKLYEEMEIERKMKLVSAEVIKALQISVAVSPEVKTSQTEVAANIIRGHVWPCYPEEYVKDYEKENGTYISRSEDTVRRWAEVLSNVFVFSKEE